MIKEIITVVISAVMILNSTSLFAAVQTENKDNVSLADVKLLLENQKKELQRNIIIYSGAGVAAISVAGGIYAYYARKQINLLRKENEILATKVANAETLISTIAKEHIASNRKIAKNAKLLKQSQFFMQECDEYIGQIVETLNSHTNSLNTIVETMEEVATTQTTASARRPVIGFRATAEIEPTVVEDALLANKKVLKNIGGKKSRLIGSVGLIVGGGVAIYYLTNSSPRQITAVSNKRIIFERNLNKAYDNDNGFFILDVLSHAGNDTDLTASIMYESIGSDKDFYARFIKQQREAELLYKEAELKNELADLSQDISGLGGQIKNGKLNLNNAIYSL